MSEVVKNKKIRKNGIRGDFSILLFLIVQGLLFFGWLIIWLIDRYSTNPVYRQAYSLGEFLGLLVTVFLFIFFINMIMMMLSKVVSLKWWVALPIIFLLLGTPIISWILTFIGAQIARFFYIPTVEDLIEIRKDYKITLKPQKKYLPVYEVFLKAGVIEKPYTFSLWQSTIAALFGGFLGGGLLLSVNYKQLGQKWRFAIGLVLSVLLQFFLILMVFAILEWNEDITIVHLLPFLLFIPVLCHQIYSEFLQDKIPPLIANGEAKQASWWSIFWVFIIMLFFLLISHDPAYEILRWTEVHFSPLFL